MTAIHSAIRSLPDQDTTTARFKEVFNKLGHAIGWFSSMAATGHPPPETSAGGVYAPVIDGFFVMRRPRLGQYDQPLGFHLFNLYVQVATLADTLSLLRTTWHVHTTLKQLLSSHKGHPIYGAYQPLAASLEATFGSFDDAVVCGLLAAKFVEVAREWVQRTDIHSKFPPGEIIEHNWRERTSDQRAIAQQFLLYIVFGPAFARMLVESKDATDTEMRIDACNQAMAAYRGEFEDATYWQETIGRFGDCLLARQQGNWGAIQESPTNHSVMQALALWVSSENPTAKLTANFSKQLLVADFLRTTDRVGRYIRWYFNQFLYSYWLNIAMTRRFALRDPDLFSSDLRATKITSHTATTVRILQLAAGALGISIPSSIQLDSQT